ncbi:MAG: DUF547 domain-containing protein [Methyloprofundus sp.]|nr:DUF547 domain-containing protein [Methyloprofundus sp.]
MQYLIVKVFIGLLFSGSVMAKEPDWSEYKKVLAFIEQGEKHATQLALLDYSALKQNGQIEKAYQIIKQFDINQLKSHDEKLAFYINTYNILALKMVLDHWPLESIKDVGSFFSPVWGKPAGMIAGKKLSLDDVEHKIIRPMGEPRIHFAIVCASVSCPDLRSEPYTAAKLNAQLDAQATLFLHNEQKGLLLTGDEVIVSKIFHWFAEDFNKVGGVERFIRRYRPELDKKAKIEADLNYDWSVNGR